jgi:hypothetical protein
MAEQEREKERKKEKAESARMEYAQGSSISQANQRGCTATPAPVTSTPISSTRGLAHRDKGIYLPVSSRPNLTTRYQPILEMRFLLELRGLQLGNFHITEGGEWAFMVTGSRAQMVDWTTETKAYTMVRIPPRQNRLQAVVFLVLGIVTGIMVMLSVAIQPV